MTAPDDELMTALRTARPATAERASGSPAAQALLTRIVAARTVAAGARRRRPRGWMIGVPLGVAAAVTAAVGVTVTGSHRTPAPGSSSSSPWALRGAILAAFDDSSGTIMYTRATMTSGSAQRADEESWIYPAKAEPGQQRRRRYLDRGAAGAPKQDSSIAYTEPSGSGTSRVRADVLRVEYTTRTWSHETTTILVGREPDPDEIRRDIADGRFTVRRGVVLDGRRTVELTWSPGAGGTTHLWVDAHTYLPVRSTWEARHGRDPIKVITSYETLQATTANLAWLRPLVPAGFTRTRAPQRPIG